MKSIFRPLKEYFLAYKANRVYNASIAYPNFIQLFDESKPEIGDNSIIFKGCTVTGNASIGDYCKIGQDSIIHGNIGNYTNVAENCVIGKKVSIGRFCAISRGATIWTADKDYSRPILQSGFIQNFLEEEAKVDFNGGIEIGNDVWVGMSATIVNGVNVGDGAIIAAGSTVAKDVEPFEIVAGAPAEHVGWRFEEEIRKKLLEIEWWNKDPDKLKQHSKVLSYPIKSVKDLDSLNDL